jgi:hypothetical protein
MPIVRSLLHSKFQNRLKTWRYGYEFKYSWLKEKVVKPEKSYAAVYVAWILAVR